MITGKSQPGRRNGLPLLIAIMALGAVVIPLVFGSKISVSPMLLFFIVIICNISHLFVRRGKKAEDQDDEIVFNRTFFTKLAISGFYSILLIAIYQIAMTFK